MSMGEPIVCWMKMKESMALVKMPDCGEARWYKEGSQDLPEAIFLTGCTIAIWIERDGINTSGTDFVKSMDDVCWFAKAIGANKIEQKFELNGGTGRGGK